MIQPTSNMIHLFLIFCYFGMIIEKLFEPYTLEEITNVTMERRISSNQTRKCNYQSTFIGFKNNET